MQHFTTWPSNSHFVCGALALGQHISRLAGDPEKTTCPDCRATEAWAEAHAESPARRTFQTLVGVYRLQLAVGDLEAAAETRRVIIACN